MAGFLLRLERVGSTARSISLVDEFSAELTADPPCKAALSGSARRKDDRELRGNLDVFGDHLHTAGRNIGYLAVPRQRAGPELNLCEAIA